MFSISMNFFFSSFLSQRVPLYLWSNSWIEVIRICFYFAHKEKNPIQICLTTSDAMILRSILYNHPFLVILNNVKALLSYHISLSLSSNLPEPGEFPCSCWLIQGLIQPPQWIQKQQMQIRSKWISLPSFFLVE